MSYEITIKRTQTFRREVDGKWCQVGTKETERDMRYYTQEERAAEPKTRIDPVYGYADRRHEDVTETTEILKQVVDELDLPAVIRAINKLGDK
jgi:hypothetical protein